MKYAKRFAVGLLAISAWSALAVYLALDGVWLSPVAEEDNTASFYDWAVEEIRQNNKGNAALALLEDGQVVQQFFMGPQDPVDKDTLFSTASFSKWVTAMSVMSLVESNTIDLDAPVSSYLSRWPLPESGFNNDQVTPRRLLSHTAGLTDGLGFGDYEANESLPTLEEALRKPRASSATDVEIAVGVEPGTEFIYSGGGYLILQLLIEELSGLTFRDYVQASILDPAGMRRSSYDFIAQLENASASYNPDGSRAPSYKYASPAATGLSSSISDLSSLASKMLSDESGVISSVSIEAMREPHGFVLGAGIWGLGTMLYAPTPGGDYVFGHDGANDPAINSTMRLNPDTADAIVLLVSGHPTLASNIGSQWVLWQTGYPDFLSTEKALRSALLPILCGSLVLIVLIYWLTRRRA